MHYTPCYIQVVARPTDPEFAVAFEWDDANEEHLARHGVVSFEVEQVFRNGAAFRPNTRGRDGWSMQGKTNGGRRLVAVVVWQTSTTASSAR